LNKKFKL